MSSLTSTNIDNLVDYVPDPDPNFIKVLRLQGKKSADDLADKLEAKLLAKSSSNTVVSGQARAATEEWLGKFVTNDPLMLEQKRIIRKILSNKTKEGIEAPILITGPTGTGKELLAKAIHGGSPGLFVDINCAGLPEHLVESELFGHVRGAYTDAREAKAGLIRKAEKGVLFLDEIGELDLKLQAKFLRVLQERTVRKVGGEVNECISCRFVAATKHRLEDLVETKQFRDDLFWRLNMFRIETTGLDKRPNDVPLIIKSLLPKGTVEIPTELLAAIKPSHYEQGNVRSLQAIVQRYYILGVLPN